MVDGAPKELDRESVRRSAKAGDLTLNYYEAGAPPPVGGGLPLVMLHGGGPGASAWSNFGSALPGFAEDFRTLLIDQPGFGQSDKPEVVGNYFRFAAEAVKDLLDEEDFTHFRSLAEKANSFIDGDRLIDAAGYIEANNDYHRFLFQRSGNEAMLQSYTNLNTVAVMDDALEDAVFIEPGIAEEHLAIIDAIEAKDMNRVRELLSSHNHHAISTPPPPSTDPTMLHLLLLLPLHICCYYVSFIC